jgi:hypothetical protein
VRKALIFAPILVLAATACGAPGANGSSDQAGSSAYPSELFGAWQDEGQTVVFKLSDQGQCVVKFAGYASAPCTYSVARSGMGPPTPNQPWILQADFPDEYTSYNVVAIDPKQITVSDGAKLEPLTRVSDDLLKDCVGKLPATCDGSDKQSCETVPGCSWSAYCEGYGYSCGAAQSAASCSSKPDCYWNEGCSGSTATCLELGPDECDSYPPCHLR